MFQELRRILDKDETLTESDFNQAAAVAIQRQFLFCDKTRDQRHYRLILDAEDYFRKLFNAINLNLMVDRPIGYVGVVPQESYLTVGLDTEQTLFLLVLRVVYEQAARECRVGENSQVFTNSDVTVDFYVAHTGRKRPLLGKLREIIRTFSRQGLVEIDQDEDKLIQFRIRPSIRDIMSPGYLQALESFTAGEREDGEIDIVGGNDEDID